MEQLPHLRQLHNTLFKNRYKSFILNKSTYSSLLLTLLIFIITSDSHISFVQCAPKSNRQKNNKQDNSNLEKNSESINLNDLNTNNNEDKPDPSLKCLSGQYGLEYQQNMITELNFCSEHAGRTCCALNDTTKIKAKIGHAKLKTDTSEVCIAMSAKALCSHCDGDIGLGKSSGICQSYCEQWYQACKNDFFDPYVIQSSSGTGGETLPFCQKDSLICSQISEVVEHDSEKFCKIMGVKVHDGQDYNSHTCYNGLSSAQKYGNLKRKYQKSTTEQTVEDVQKAVKSAYEKLWRSFRNVIRKFVNNPMVERFIEFASMIFLLGIVWFIYTYFCAKRSRKGPQKLNRQIFEDIQRKRAEKFQSKKGK